MVGRGSAGRKVTWSSAGSYLGGVALLAVLQAVQQDADLVAALPDPIEVFTVPLLPSLIAFVAGYLARHSQSAPPAEEEAGN